VIVPERRLVWALGALAGAITGCATTGLAWVNEPESGVDLSKPSPIADSAPSAQADPSAAIARTEALTEPQGPYRLDRTVTLGEVTEAGTAPSQPGPSPSPMVVNVYVNAPAALPVYAPFYVSSTGFRPSSFARDGAGNVRSMTSAGALRPGQNWAPPPTYGPMFPYATAPASPWAGDGTRRSR